MAIDKEAEAEKKFNKTKYRIFKFYEAAKDKRITKQVAIAELNKLKIGFKDEPRLLEFLEEALTRVGKL